MLAPQSWRQFWIFQANPRQYDALSELKTDQSVDWYVSRFIDRYREGDIVYLWVAGEQAGIYGWAEVQGKVFEDKHGKYRLTTVYRGVFESPLEKSFLRDYPRAFDGLSILRNPVGANFRVTVLEAIELNLVITSQGHTAPPDPDQMEDPNMPEQRYALAEYVLDYRFNHDVKNIISACLQTSHNINQTFFNELIIQIPFIYYASRLNQQSGAEFAQALDKILPLEKIASQFRFASQVELNSKMILSANMASGIIVKRNVLVLLAEARRLAIKTTAKEQIQSRHLIGAILQGALESTQRYVQEKILQPLGLKLDEVRTLYLDYIADKWPADNQHAWQTLINEELLSTAEQQIFSPLLTVLDSDTAEQATHDLLNIDDDAIAIAKILCARDAAPPLAFGLFGEWGSGKTFFMRRVYRHVNTLTSKVADSAEESQRVYQSRVAQIWFNAWNYQDGKLWASLVNHVFVGLKQELKRLNSTTADEEFKVLMQRLDEDRLLEKRLQSSSVKLNELEKQQLDIEQRIDVLKSASETIHQQLPNENNRLLSALKLKQHASEVETVFNIPGAGVILSSVSDNIGQVKNIVEQLSGYSLLDRIKQGVKFFTRDRKATQLFLLSIFLLLSISALLIYTDLTWGSIGAAITLVSGFISTRLTRFGRFLKLIETIKQELDQAELESQQEIQLKLDKNAKEIQELHLQQLELEAEKLTAQRNFDTLNARYGQASDETFASFIFDRADSRDYKNHLGLLNMVRRDFSRLNTLLTSQNDSSLPRINRIVLYIDDLDRCEPEIVVDVLQAIHLMLAFPLFMVVVGVDARWLGRSLKRRYPFLLHEKDDADKQHPDDHAATTHDYLEKIFQIPFWLKRLDAERANEMMEALLKPHNQMRLQQAPTQADVESGTTDIDPLLPTDSLFEETEDQAENYNEQSNSEELMVNNLVSTRALDMSKAELLFFKQLGAIVGRSPRAVKRFINLYRILKASHKKARVAGFSDENGDFRIPLFLLSVICGSPKEAEPLFLYCKQQAGGTLMQQALPGAENFQQSEGWANLMRALNESVNAIGMFELQQINEWIPEVARFSYREWVH